MRQALQALAKLWHSQNDIGPSLARFIETLQEELSTCPKSLEAAWLAVELATLDPQLKQSLESRLAQFGAAQGVFCPGASPMQCHSILGVDRSKPRRAKDVQQLAPKFFMPGDPRPSSQRTELDRLRRRKKRLEKRIGAELAEAGREAHHAASLKAEKRRQAAQRRSNRMINELQQMKKVVERENTSAVLAPAQPKTRFKRG